MKSYNADQSSLMVNFLRKVDVKFSLVGDHNIIYCLRYKTVKLHNLQQNTINTHINSTYIIEIHWNTREYTGKFTTSVDPEHVVDTYIRR